MVRFREITGGRGVDVAFDFVGLTPTIATATGAMAQGGRLTVVGIAGGQLSARAVVVPHQA